MNEPGCDVNHDGDFQGALDAAELNLGEDAVLVGPNTYDAGPYTYTGEKVTITGAGVGETILTIDPPAAAAFERVFELNSGDGSEISGLTIELPDDGDNSTDRGLSITSDADVADDFEVRAAGGNNLIGITGRGTFRNGTVDLGPVGGGGGGHSAASVFLGAVLEDMILRGDNGVQGSEGVTVRRSRIRATRGVSTDNGQVDVDNSVIDLGDDAGATGLEAANDNTTSLVMTVNADHVTIVGGGADSVGARAQADDGTEEATINLSNSVIANAPTNALSAEADNGRTATITTTYSNYNAATNVENPDIDGVGATGTATINEADQTDHAPGFVDPGNDDYHLAQSSALIDIGDPAAPAPGETDIDGDPRELDGDEDGTARRDMGADEVVTDGDGIPFASDNCPDNANPGQQDSDGDGIGDACDATPFPPPSPPPPPSPQPPALPADTSVTLELRGKKKVKAGRAVKVKAICPEEACEVVARAIFRVPKKALRATAAKKRKLKTKEAEESLQPDVAERLKMKPGKKARKKLKRAARKKRFRKRIMVVVKATATDDAGNVDKAKRKLKLK